MEGVSESKALQECFSAVATAISASDPLKVGDELFTASLVSQETLAKLDLPTNTAYQRSRILVMAVLDQVKLVPEKLDTFMEILKKCVDESSYSKLFCQVYGGPSSEPSPKKARLGTVSSPMEVYQSFLKRKYLDQKMPNYGKWPNLPSRKYINLTVIERESRSQEAAPDNSKALTYSHVVREGDLAFQDVAKPSQDEVSKFVLVEGAPGVGKSTFSWEACRKWAEGEILNDFELVILIRLRDESVRKATCLGDLIKYPRDPKIRQKVIAEITETGGERVLLLLEGYDELPAFLREDSSLFTDIIKGNQFDAGTVMVTSRHWASKPFLLPNDNERQLSQRIEILGFTEENRMDYISSMLEEPSLLEGMKQYLKLCPHIYSMMYIPLNCAIVVEVYRNSKKQSLPVPKTMTELYSSLIRSILLRHMYDLPEYKDKSIALETFSDLPESIKTHFNSLAKLAYEGIVENSQQVIFTEKDTPSGLDGLGLLQSTMELYVDVGAKISFNFLHLTIQEYMAAYHISAFPLDKQIACFKDWKHGDTDMVVTFLAGMCPSAFIESLKELHPGPVMYYDKDDIHRLFEATIKPLIILPHESCDAYDEVILFDPLTLYMLGYIVSSFNSHWVVYIRDENYGLSAFQMFVRGITNGCQPSPGGRLDLFVGGHQNVKFTELTNITLVIEELHFVALCDPCTMDPEYFIIDVPPAHADFELFFANARAKGNSLTIKKLFFDKFHFNKRDMEEFKLYLTSATKLNSLELENCKYPNVELMDGVQACGCLEKLTLKFVNIDVCDSLCKMLLENKTLKELVIQSLDIHKLKEISAALSKNCYLEKTTIKTVTFFCPPPPFRMSSAWREINVAEASALPDPEPEEMWNKISDYREINEAESIASILKFNTTLRELTLNLESMRMHYFHDEVLFDALSRNQTLEKLTVFCDENLTVDSYSKDKRLQFLDNLEFRGYGKAW